VQCHTDIDEYPHREIPAQTSREYTIIQNEACARCHPGSAEANEAGAHQIYMEAGNLETAVCSDCHSAHDVNQLTPPRSNIPQTCERCHSQIYQEYEESSHGSALIGEGNPDVPDCTTCHGNHEIKGPNSSDGFKLYSPQLCAECHANEALMSKYGISTNVFDTYISDFHGTTVNVFERISPDQETNKPVCIDCHGVHNMKSASDPESQVMKDNLLETCQKCHPNASENFSSSWLGHYEPSLDKYPLLFFVDLFYKIIIPVTVGGMLAFIAIDAQYRIRKKISKKNNTEVKK
jgi:predicted CXXCH cytochrome family protein